MEQREGDGRGKVEGEKEWEMEGEEWEIKMVRGNRGEERAKEGWKWRKKKGVEMRRVSRRRLGSMRGLK